MAGREPTAPSLPLTGRGRAPGPGRSCFLFHPHRLAVSPCEGQSEVVFRSPCLLRTPAESAPQEGSLGWGLSSSWVDSGSVLLRGLVGPGSCLCPSQRCCRRPTKALGPGVTQGPGETLPPPLVGWVDDGHAGASGALGQTVGTSLPPVPGLPCRATLTPAASLGVRVPTLSGDGRAQVTGQAGCRR